MSHFDLAVFTVAEVVLVALAALAATCDVRGNRKARQGGCNGVARRGERSMAALFTFYGVTTVVYSLLVGAAQGVENIAVTLIVLNYVCLTYLFFFSSWFRNRVFFPLLSRIRED